MCRGTRSSASHTSEARATQVLSSKGPAATGPFHDSLRYPLLLIFPPDRVEVPGNAGHIHREAQDFKKQVHRLHPNRRSERCPQADSAAGKILPYTPQRGISDPSVRVMPICMDDICMDDRAIIATYPGVEMPLGIRGGAGVGCWGSTKQVALLSSWDRGCKSACGNEPSSIRGAVSPESSVPGCHACQVRKAHSGIALHGSGDLFWTSRLWGVGESCLDGSFGHHALGAVLP